MAKGYKGPGKGRPSLYKPEYCQQLIDTLRQGLFVESFCGDIEIAKDTFYNWVQTHEDFSDAFSRAKTLQQKAWMEKGLLNIDSPTFNAGIYKLFMANLCDFHTEKKIIDSKVNATVETNSEELTALSNQVKGLMDELRHRQTKNKK